jgi:hypothetical protein
MYGNKKYREYFEVLFTTQRCNLDDSSIIVHGYTKGVHNSSKPSYSISNKHLPRKKQKDISNLQPYTYKFIPRSESKGGK